MKQLILATAVALTSLTTAAQVQLPTDIEASLGQAKMSGGVRIEAMNIQALRESLSQVRTRAVFHLDANNQIELIPSASTRDRSTTRPGEFVGSGGGTMEEDVIDLTGPEGVTGLKFVGMEDFNPRVELCPYGSTLDQLARSGKDCLAVLLNQDLQPTSNDPLVYSAPHLVDVHWEVLAHSSEYFLRNKSTSALIQIVYIKYDRSKRRDKWGRYAFAGRDIVYSSFIPVKKGVLNVIPVRTVQVKHRGHMVISKILSPLKLEYGTRAPVKKLGESATRANTSLTQFNPDQENTQSYYLSPGNYEFKVEDPRGTFTVERTIE